jgi:hypothetical protein
MQSELTSPSRIGVRPEEARSYLLHITPRLSHGRLETLAPIFQDPILKGGGSLYAPSSWGVWYPIDRERLYIRGTFYGDDEVGKK